MIRAWTIIRGRAKEPEPRWVEAAYLQYPVFPTMKAARVFMLKRPQGSEKSRIVRCQIRIEGK